MQPAFHFRHCPSCGQPAAAPGSIPFHCVICNFHYYFNPTVAVAALIVDESHRVLFIKRAKEPAKGKLALPGGYVDIGETAEDALRREVREEVNLEIGSLEFLGSQTNDYLYLRVNYPVLDLFFITRAKSLTGIAALDGVTDFSWLDPRTVTPSDIAFRSIREAVRIYASNLNATP